eukprot:SAG11_NODE_2380_length_3429_cov_1.764865_1_plen_155_part_00
MPVRRSVRATRDGILKFQGLNLATLQPVHGGDTAASTRREAEILEEAAQRVVAVVGGAVLNAMRADTARSSEPEAEEPAPVMPAAASPQSRTTTVEGWFERLRQEGAAAAMAELGAEEPADLLDLEPEDIAAIAMALPKLKAKQFKRFMEEARV